jgi:hypothetical protein
MGIRNVVISIKRHAIFSQPVVYAVLAIYFAIAGGSAKGQWMAIIAACYCAACFGNSIARLTVQADEEERGEGVPR